MDAPIRLLRGPLGRFREPLRVRDPRGRTRRPALRPEAAGSAFRIEGPFNLLQRFRVRPEIGARFCAATHDTNPLHLEADIVPGAYTAARTLLVLEVLLPGFEVRSCTLKCSAPARYGPVCVAQWRIEPDRAGGGLSVRARTLQAGRPVASVEARLERCCAERVRVPYRQLDRAALRKVRAFCRALGIEPRVCVGSHAPLGFRYPQAYLASLPSGEMVRRLRGEGGVLNKLALRFEPGARPSLSVGALEVSLERPPRSGRAFQRVITAIGRSVKTYMTATALVLRDGAALLRPAPAAAPRLALG